MHGDGKPLFREIQRSQINLVEVDSSKYTQSQILK